ncbi:YggS family pyridoxal phosphate-dependent enzyme [Xylophilus sp. Leaf220]|jgi:pyridoxal phosphate enzyme (YggS family)|uniref:YggS family pyridoxal phosphate-dependent enzyme n=1 Tax=Xylophilus sp. Leaf220 TaxID=1735686 RepID=UPI0007022139|nr:YggS family pyridoxal phosphate-dependent enzyme [Xylophilus sp. Leaf220]KQM70243.1 YggS family pyridoxal phosphate enzyme [Xylophilus sp. Leaf220]
MTTIGNNIHKVHDRIAAACAAAGRPAQSVRLLAVSKTFGAQDVREAVAAGQQAFGENYLQEGVEKVEALAGSGIEWHCIGPVQSNKTRLAATHFDWVHSVDRLKIAERLSAQRPEGRPPLDVCLQVDIDGGANKSGVSPADLPALAHAVAALPGLRLRGLMTIPEPQADMAAQRAVHARTRALFDALVAEGLPLDTLSMGMSADLEAAVAEGSTMVRVGTAIFGGRTPHSAP